MRISDWSFRRVLFRSLVEFPVETPVALGIQDMRWMSRNVMAREKALFAGHPVAAVAATSQSIAARALELIEVDYEVLPWVMDVEEANRPDAPILHDFARLDRKSTRLNSSHYCASRMPSSACTKKK